MYINEKALKYREFLKGKNADVLGAGISNAPLIELLVKAGANVTVRDKKKKEELPFDAEALENKGVKFVSGEEYLSDISGDIIFRTPGIRYDAPGIINAIAAGAIITSEMEAFISICPAKMIVITGSDGKTTTSTLTAKILEAAGHKVFLGGNIGTPLLARVDEMTPDDFAVLELSSFQLHTVNRFENVGLPFGKLEFPSASVITNISPNHLNWHTDMDEYVEAKAAVFRNMQRGMRFVTNIDYPITKEMSEEARDAGLDVVCFSSKTAPERGYFIENKCIMRTENGVKTELLRLEDILIPGIHNAENYMAAIALTEAYVGIESVKRVASTFGGVEHRLELCRVKDGVRFYNSSIDSSPSRTLAALSTFGEKTLVLVMGGADKNIPFDNLGDEVVKKARAVFLSGPTSDKIAESIERSMATADEKVVITKCACFDDAVKAAANAANEGENVLLSPACTSFDAFKNFEERGRRFKEIVAEL